MSIRALKDAAKRAWMKLSPGSFNALFWEARGRGYSHEAMSEAYRAMYEEMAGLCAEPSPRAVLEFGCGYGYLLSRIAARGGAVERFAGVDLSSSQIAAAKSFFPAGEFAVADLTRPLPFENGAFDVVAGVGVLMYLPPDGARAAVRGLRRVCAKRLVLAEFSYGHLDEEGKKRFMGAVSYDGRHAHDLEKLLRECGFSRVEVRPIASFSDPVLNPKGEMAQTLFLASP